MKYKIKEFEEIKRATENEGDIGDSFYLNISQNFSLSFNQ